MQFNPISLEIGLLFSALAAAAAFLITYGEYTRHYTDKKKPLKIAIETAVFTLAIFGIISLAMSVLLQGI